MKSADPRQWKKQPPWYFENVMLLDGDGIFIIQGYWQTGIIPITFYDAHSFPFQTRCISKIKLSCYQKFIQWITDCSKISSIYSYSTSTLLFAIHQDCYAHVFIFSKNCVLFTVLNHITVKWQHRGTPLLRR